jgi:hypothetical protein
VAERGGRLLGLVEGGDRALQVLVIAELEHRPLAAAHHQGVVVVEVEVRQLWGLLEQGRDLGRVEGPHRDQVVRRPSALVTRIRELVGVDPAAVRARDGHLIPRLGELVERVEQFGRPEAHRPAGGRRRSRVRHHHQHVRPAARAGDVDGLVVRVAGILDLRHRETS